MLTRTPSQTVGPYFSFLLRDVGSELVSPDAPGAVRIRGRVLDGAGDAVPDAMLEIWQANGEGRYADQGDARFTGFGRGSTDEDGWFEFVTVKPGVVSVPEGRPQGPHIAVSVFARGLLKRLVTRIYFPDEEAANADDPVLSSIEHPEARATLVAEQENGWLRFDVHLQGDRQTTFFDV